MGKVYPAKDNAGQMKELTDKLEQGLKELFESGRYKNYLAAMSKFHAYSVNNTILIAMQKPDATYVAGYSTWKNQFGRNVRKGEKGIKIFAPSPYKAKREMEQLDPATQKPVLGEDGKPVMRETEIIIPAFKPATVFDVSQTEGKELPSIGVEELAGDVEKYKDYFKAIIRASPVPVSFEKMEGGIHGCYLPKENRIAIKEGMSEMQSLKTLVHEIAHARLHGSYENSTGEDGKDGGCRDTSKRRAPDRNTREVQAESVAYVVCLHYGLDASDYSFGYIAGWSKGKELQELKASLETIRTASADIINCMDEYLTEQPDLRREMLADIHRHGYRPAEGILDKMEKLGRLAGRSLGIKEINDMYRKNSCPESTEMESLVKELAKDFQRQELLNRQIVADISMGQ